VKLAAIVSGVVSALALVFYGVDKAQAARGGRRVRESTLHLLELLGGWPGALLGMSLFRHKTRKASFLVVTWGIVLLHAAAWALAWREGWLR
jgi:uncharacterized membrane protein YsdA (DUF1294 family)